MSHFINDQIADQAIDDACAKVADMAFSAVSRQLIQRGKGTQFLVGPLADKDKARDALIDLIADDLFQAAMDRPGPHGYEYNKTSQSHE